MYVFINVPLVDEGRVWLYGKHNIDTDQDTLF